MMHFVTLFPEAKNVELIKDNGQIPFQMQQLFDYKSTLVCYDNDDYTYLKDEVKGLRLHFIEDTGKCFYFRKAALRYILRHAKKIDVLNLYYMSQESVLLGRIYKWLNPAGILYIKLDLAQNQLSDSKTFRFSAHPVKEKIHQKMFQYFLPKIDIISVESKHVKRQIEHLFEPFDKELLLLRNGLDGDFIKKVKNEFKPL